MGSGRDKRRKHEDPAKVQKRAEKQAKKVERGVKDSAAGVTEGGVALYGEEDIVTTVAKLRKVEEKKRSVVVTEKVAPPSPRANAVFVPSPTRTDELILFGGELWDGVNTRAYNDLYVFSVGRRQWKLVNAPLTPSPRSSCQAFTHKQCLYVHGGEFVSQSQSQFLHFRDLWKLDCNTCVWEELKIKNAPPARSGHRIVPWKRNAVLFGGFYDNALETRYFDDLWVLSEIESGGKWDQVTFAAHSEGPHKRSGHCMAVFEDQVFVYGGYSTEKLNRFGKTEATVHHDLWMAPLSAQGAVLWTKVRLGGIPPPIRSGIAFATREKKLFLFGGVVDIDAPGGRTTSSFQNDIFVLQLDTKKFYPLLLTRPKKQAGARSPSGQCADGGNTGDLAAQLNAMNLGLDDSSDSEDETSPGAASGAPPTPPEEPAAYSHRFVHPGQAVPCGRFNGMLCCSGNALYLFGGQFEEGKKEFTLADLLMLNLNRLETWEVLQSMELSALRGQWKGADDDAASEGSWEDGSTVVDTDEIARLAELDGDGDLSDDPEDLLHRPAEGRKSPPAATLLRRDQNENNEDVAPDAIPATEDTPIPGLDSRSTIRGKIGRKAHKEQLKAQLGSTAVVPSPLHGETQEAFFVRTEQFWMDTAREAQPESSEKKLSKSARKFCHLRYDEATALMAQIEQVEEAQREEDAWIREHLAKKRAAKDEAERGEAEEDEDEEELEAA